MLQPKKTKYRKQFRGKMRGVSIAGSKLVFGEIGLKSMGTAWLTAAQIEAARRSITNYTKRGGRVWIRVFPDKPVTKKSPGAPMGGGKGDVDTYVAVVKPGRILFEIAGVVEEEAREALRRASSKIPFLTKVVVKS